ncbi:MULTISPECIES: polysaccharide pyruvyl transferase CsaB [Geobacillus]|uniref:polysaccharide pyruvyl transferase CsaB n=3 Tax=Anoxybacillaceae TaxID=3120669 RepID=UPI00040E2F7F|nr:MULTISPECIES: polysaccharide pyruvyl transferase CsaB [Geobacillus]AOL35820.1 polysaccharide pyruvyl transferase CsaB [Geobacillus thermoleovorans]WMJ19775.1 polysaccharide pyruvyl transferase CsaB [Geobacillus kaustophilus]
MKIVISGFYGFGNTGDEAILEAIIDNLRTELSNPTITVFSFSPEQTAKTHGVKSVYRGWRRDNKEKIHALRNADLLVSGGGGLLQDVYPTRFLFGPLPYYLLIVFLAKLCGTKVMFFSQGIGPVNTKWGKLLMRVFGNMANLITVRDEYSKQLLQHLGVKKPEIVVTADIVFAFHHKTDDACINSLLLQGNEQLIAVSVRPWFHHRDYYEKVAKALDQLIELEGITPIFVPMEGEHDVRASEQVVRQMAHGASCHILRPDFTPNQYLHFLHHCRLTIGMRLHSLIFSALAGVPHIGLSYDPKVESLLRRSGMWDYSFRLEDVHITKLVENARYMLRHREPLSRMIRKNTEKMRRDALENIRLLKERFYNAEKENT